MAQAKRRRSTKHRGNAAGVVEARGRTGRPPTAEEKKRAARDRARTERLTKQPTWASSVRRAGLAALFMFVFVLVASHPKHGSAVMGAVLFALLAMAIYVPAGFYLERYLWRRRMARMGRPVGR